MIAWSAIDNLIKTKYKKKNLSSCQIKCTVININLHNSICRKPKPIPVDGDRFWRGQNVEIKARNAAVVHLARQEWCPLDGHT